MKKRYPGPLPFAYDDRDLFFGRDEEIEYLTTVIINNKSTILHGKSGYGKSSLISAGIIPNLIKNYRCEIIRVRFYNHDKKNPVKPRITLLNTIRQYVNGPDFLEKLIIAEHRSAWRYFKRLQLDLSKRTAANDIPELGYILVFDQFEELFTYPKNDVKEFGKELHELLLHRIPEEYQEHLKESFKQKELLDSCKEELSILDKDIPVKILFSMRDDRFNYLTHLVNYIPNLLSNTFKIKRLASNQVREAIVQPALVENGFFSPRFSYQDTLVERILEFLRTDNDGEEDEKIEVFEMQIICGKLEEIVTDYVAKNPVSDSGGLVLLTEEMVLKSPSIEDKQAPFKEIIKNYYKETINSIQNPVEQLSARYLIEMRLIDPVTRNRISLDTALVSQTGISIETQSQLIDKRIIRKEINTVSGKSLELSHDSLVIPILHAAQELGDLNKKLTDFFNESLNNTDKGRENKIRNIVYNILLEERNPLNPHLLKLDPETIEDLRSSPLLREGKLVEGIDDDIYRFSIKETFQKTAQQSKIKSQQSHTKDWVKKFVLATGVFLIVVTYLLYTINENNKTSNKLRALVFLGYVDTIKNKDDALQLTKYIYDREILKGDDTSLIRVKFAKLIQTQEIQSKISRFNYPIPTTNLKPEEIDISQTGHYMVISDDGDNQLGRGAYKVLDRNGKVQKVFERVLYTYFTNRPGVLLLALSDTSMTESLYNRINTASNEFILYQCSKNKADTVSMGVGRYLYPQNYQAGNHINEKNDSYRMRFSANGNLIIPFYQVLPTDQYVQQVRVITLNNNRFDRRSEGSVSSSRNGRKFMTVQNRSFKIYNENGPLLETINNIDFADFTQNGSLLATRGTAVSLRDSLGLIRSFNLPDSADYAYADGSAQFIVAELPNRIYMINTSNSAVNHYEEQLVDLNFNRNIILARSSGKDDRGRKTPDTLKRRSISGKGLITFESPAGIQAVKYNAAADEILLLTNSDQLLLLDAALKVKAGFQLTPNDLFGFSDDGKSIYYVRNDFISVFDNDDKLINFFDFDASLEWAGSLKASEKKPGDSNKRERLLRRKYDLEFQQKLF